MQWNYENTEWQSIVEEEIEGDYNRGELVKQCIDGCSC